MTRDGESGVVRKSVRVQTPIERAFSVFVEQMETWWPAEHHIGAKPFASIFVEPRAGGRWYERAADGETCDWGRVLVWEPPHRVTFSWHLGVDWKFDPSLERASEVALRFTAGRAISNVGGTGTQQDRTAWRGLRAASRVDGWARCVGAHAAGVRGWRQMRG